MKIHSEILRPMPGRRSRGFSLMELLFAITLFGVILVAFFNLLPASVMAVRHAEHRIEAVAFAESLIESKRAGPFSQITATPTVSPSVGNDGTTYNYTYDTPEVTGKDPGILTRIRVTVTWREKDNTFTLHRELDVCRIRR